MNIDDILKLCLDFEAQTSEPEILELYNAVLSTPPGDVLEVGSATGGTTIALIHAAKEVGKIVYSIDPYPEELENKANDYTEGMMGKFKEKFRQNILNDQYDNIIQFNEDIKNCINKIPDKLSVVFIDGCHEFAYVKAEYELLFTRIVSGGVMYIHDIYSPTGQISKSDEQGVSQILKWGIGEIFSSTLLKIIK